MVLTEALKTILLMAVKTSGTYEPDTALSFVVEGLTPDQYRDAHAFLSWIQKEGKTFGWGNVNELWLQWQKTQARKETDDTIEKIREIIDS